MPASKDTPWSLFQDLCAMGNPILREKTATTIAGSLPPPTLRLHILTPLTKHYSIWLCPAPRRNQFPNSCFLPAAEWQLCPTGIFVFLTSHVPCTIESLKDFLKNQLPKKPQIY